MSSSARSAPLSRRPLPESRRAGDYRRFPPGPGLGAMVESIWVQSHPAAPGSPPTTVLPAGRAELIVHFGDPFQHLTETDTHTLPAAVVLGQRTRALRVRATGATGLVIVCLHPWATGALLADAGAPLTDQFVPLEALTSRALSERLTTRMHEASTVAARVEIVRQELGALLRGSPDPLAVETVRRAASSWGAISVNALCRGLGVSRRTLARRVLWATGVGPKQVLSLSRYQKALGALRAGLDWSAVVDRCGYYDQSHLIRELKAYTGSTPTRLTRAQKVASPLATAFNSRDLSHFSNTVYL